jgi:hypothetical protein
MHRTVNGHNKFIGEGLTGQETAGVSPHAARLYDDR